MVLERTTLGLRLKEVWVPLQHVYALLVVVFGFVLFRADTFSHAAYYYQALLGLTESSNNWDLFTMYINNEMLFFLSIGLLSCTPFWLWAQGKIIDLFPDKNWSSSILEYGYGIMSTLVMMALLVSSLMYLAADQYNPFIYFRF